MNILARSVRPMLARSAIVRVDIRGVAWQGTIRTRLDPPVGPVQTPRKALTMEVLAWPKRSGKTFVTVIRVGVLLVARLRHVWTFLCAPVTSVKPESETLAMEIFALAICAQHTSGAHIWIVS